ncbi:hypothetical protein JXA40_04900 [bacterium]|nr:hypothetical protein [candidate division CSSED10-310 bacterium]
MKNESHDDAKSESNVNIALSFKDTVEIFKLMVTSRISLMEATETVIDRHIDRLVDGGKMSRTEGEKAKKEARDAIRGGVRKITDRIDAGMQRTLNALHIATINDLKSVEEKLDLMNKRLDSLLASIRKTRQPRSRKSAKKSSPKNARKSTGKPKPGPSGT